MGGGSRDRDRQRDRVREGGGENKRVGGTV